MADSGSAGSGEAKKTGKVKWFNNTKGFGFITQDDEGEDLFVHQTSIHADGFRSLKDGESVEFLVDQGEDRAKAIDVTGRKAPLFKGLQGVMQEHCACFLQKYSLTAISNQCRDLFLASE